MLQVGKLQGLIRSPSASRAMGKSASPAPRSATKIVRPKSISRTCTTTSEVQADSEEGREDTVKKQTLGNIYRHTAKDHFDWGSIKDRIFGDFGKRPEQPPIRRLSFVPDPTSDEMIIPRYVLRNLFPSTLT